MKIYWETQRNRLCKLLVVEYSAHCRNIWWLDSWNCSQVLRTCWIQWPKLNRKLTTMKYYFGNEFAEVVIKLTWSFLLMQWSVGTLIIVLSSTHGVAFLQINPQTKMTNWRFGTEIDDDFLFIANWKECDYLELASTSHE